jgi:hypothetical protein
MEKENSKEKKYWSILKKHLGKEYLDDFSHGLPHIKRVYLVFDIFRRLNKKVRKDIIDVLECAIIFHDIGRPEERKEKKEHAAISVEILEALFKKKLKDVKNKDWIIYSVANHSRFTPGQINDQKYKCYALLTFFDAMDAIGGIGILRDLVYQKIRDLPFMPLDRGYLKEINQYIDDPKNISNEDIIKMKKGSVLGHIFSNYCVMVKEILPRANSLLSPELKKEAEKRLNLMKDFILFNKTRPG